MKLLSLFLSLFFWHGRQQSTMAFVSPQPPASVHTHRAMDTRHFLDIGSMIRNFGKKVTASHILIGPPGSITGRGMEDDDAIAKLVELKEEIGNDPEKFASAAEEFSSCRATMKKGGDLGEFGPGMMVGPFDKICFEEDVGVVHGPVATPYGQHLILVRERTGDK